ncbi:MAG: murein biosynthesis integral membrane protein MurJ [Luteitalea sp.]|nr:murein biosynthesis integral membrane protein MurJ [Luteitalea sp.]
MPASDAIARPAGLAGAATLASRLLGLARDQVLAAFFGASHDMDAFVVAFRIPNLVRDLFAEGAMSAAFVPTFTQHLTRKGRNDAWRVGNHTLNAVALFTGILVVVGVIFARPLVTAVAGGFAEVPGKLELTVRLTRIVLPFLTLVAIASVLMGMLNSLQHYFVPALAPAAFNLATIVCAFALAPVMPRFGMSPIVAIAVGALIGGLGQVALQWRPLATEGFRYRPVLDLNDPGLRRVLLLMGPGTIGLAATQVNLFVNTIFATSAEPGAVSWLQYAFRLMYLPIGLFGVSIATAVLPVAARHAALDDPQAVSRTVARGVGLMTLLNIPATVGLFLLADDIVRLLFERGRFLPVDTAATAGALRGYAVGLVGYSATRIASPVFYALGQSRLPVILSTISIGVNVLLSLLLVQPLGFRGLALATSLAASVNGGLSLVLLRRRLGGLQGRHLAATFTKMAIASLMMAAAVEWTADRVPMLIPGSGVASQATRLAAAVFVGLLTLGITCRLLRVAEMDDVLAEARGRLRKFIRH